MRVNRKSTSLVAAVVGALFIALTQPPVAEAAIKAQSNNALSVVSGKVVIFASASQTFVNTGVQLSTSVTNGTKTFYVNNSGSLAVSRFVLTINLPNNSNISAFRSCTINVAFSGNNVCASGSSTLLSNPNSGSAATYILALPGNSFYSFQITQNKSGTMTVDASASLTFVTPDTYNS